MADRYTKCVLTVIAACLLWLCAMTTGNSAQAQQLTQVNSVPAGVQPVVVVGWGSVDVEGRISLRLVNQNGARRTDTTLPVRADAPLQVELPYTSASPLSTTVVSSEQAPLRVQISSVKKGAGPWEPIRAQVEDAPVRLKPGGGQ
jgi:hypothetical protein